MTTFNPGWNLADRTQRERELYAAVLNARIRAMVAELKRRVSPDEVAEWGRAAVLAHEEGKLQEYANDLAARLSEFDHMDDMRDNRP